MMTMNGTDGTGLASPGGRRSSRAVMGLLVVGGWLVVSPLVLSTTLVTAGLISAVTGGLVLAVLACWAMAARNRIPPLAIACFFGLWLLVAPSLWEFGDGADTGLVPITPSEAIEPARAAIARAEWNSILAGLLTLALAGLVLLASRRRKGRSVSTGSEHRQQVEAPDGRR
jgi:hypothetical protein